MFPETMLFWYPLFIFQQKMIRNNNLQISQKKVPNANLQIQNDNLQNCEIMIRSNTLQILQKNIQQDNWLLHKHSQTINWHKNLPILIWNDNLQTLPKGAGTPICKI